MPVSSVRALSVTAIFIACMTIPRVAGAESRSRVTIDSGLILITFPVPEGAVTAYLADDVAPGERFSGRLEGPSGFVLMVGNQRAKAGEAFHWRAPDGADPRMTFVLLDPTGQE